MGGKFETYMVVWKASLYRTRVRRCQQQTNGLRKRRSGLAWLSWHGIYTNAELIKWFTIIQHFKAILLHSIEAVFEPPNWLWTHAIWNKKLICDHLLACAKHHCLTSFHLISTGSAFEKIATFCLKFLSAVLRCNPPCVSLAPSPYRASIYFLWIASTKASAGDCFQFQFKIAKQRFQTFKFHDLLTPKEENWSNFPPRRIMSWPLGVGLATISPVINTNLVLNYKLMPAPNSQFASQISSPSVPSDGEAIPKCVISPL